MIGMTNSGGLAAYKANQALTLAQEAKNTADEAKATADEAKEEAEQGGGGGIELADVTDVTVTSADGKVSLKWTDPDNIVYNGATLARWTGTLVVRKEGSAPTSKTDGTTVVDSTTKNAYSSTAYEDTGLTNGTTYYYRFFPHTAGTYTAGTSVNATPNKLDPNLAVSSDSVTLYSGASSSTKTVTVTSDSAGALSVESDDTSVATATISGNTVTITFVAVGTATVTVTQASNGDYKSDTKTIAVTAAYGIRYGYRVKKTESDPSARVEYLFDAVGKTPAAMNFTTGVFSYGDWANEWFVTENKPLMLKNDGTVDYYLDPDDYTKKEDGVTASDVSNTNYAGNAMAQFPLCWIKRYEDNDYYYEIVSNVQYDSDYKAYAHTRADGSIADFFYWSCFGGYKDGNGKMRSIAGQTLSQSLTAQQEIDACLLNGAKWYTHTWSQRELIRTLCVLMGKSTDTQSVFGTGNCCSGNASSMKTTGTLKDKGQFYGYSANNNQVKVFHIEKFWGDQWDRTAGLINNSGNICVKMTPEGQGYRVTDVTGYTATGKTLAGGGYISAGYMSEYGFIPTTVTSGTETTYECDYVYVNNGQLDYLLSGDSAYHAAGPGGAFAFVVNIAPSDTGWSIGCGLSCEQPAAA